MAHASANAPAAATNRPAARAAAGAPAPDEATSNAARAAVVDPLRAARIAALEWSDLSAAVDACRACALGATRRLSVPGSGDRAAQWLLVGEGPGAEEDQRGLPFVGASGALLDSMLAALGLQREESVYIANVVKCRPPANRTPDAVECAACLPFLQRQITLIQPRIIVAFGLVAAQSLLQTRVNVGSLRGKVHEYAGIPLVVTYHPAYLLRNQAEKARAWADLCLAQRTLAGAGQTGQA